MLIDSLLAGYMRFAVQGQMKLQWAERPFLLRPQDTCERLLYIHIPFCETLCPYCSFHRIRFQPEIAARYFQCLRREIGIYRDRGFNFDAVYIGGGTPTVLPVELSSVIAYTRLLWPIQRLSVEAHPRHLTADTIALLQDAGIDRLSVGVQTFDDGLLDKLSRHGGPGTGREARARLTAVRDRFDTVNVDMIYNFPEQTPAQVLEDVRILRALEMDQITFYPLMKGGIDFGSAFGRIDLRREKALFLQIVNALGDSYEPVSGWCFARQRGTVDEYIVAHDEYAGLGSGAFGYVNGILYANSFDVNGYMASLKRSDLPIVAMRRFSAGARMRYDMLMRLFGGSLDLSDLAAKYGGHPSLRLGKELLLLQITGAVKRQGRCYYPTVRGRYHMVVLMREFFTGVNQMRDFLSCRMRGCGSDIKLARD